MGEGQIRKLTEAGNSVGSRDLTLYSGNWWGSINQDVQPCDQQKQLLAVGVIPTVHTYGICTLQGTNMSYMGAIRRTYDSFDGRARCVRLWV